MLIEEEVFKLQEPQPTALIKSKTDNHQRWIWLCLIDLSNPHPEVWGFLRPLVEQHDAAIFSSQAFARQLSIPQYLFYPCIDPLSEKNKQLDASFMQQL